MVDKTLPSMDKNPNLNRIYLRLMGPINEISKRAGALRDALAAGVVPILTVTEEANYYGSHLKGIDKALAAGQPLYDYANAQIIDDRFSVDAETIGKHRKCIVDFCMAVISATPQDAKGYIRDVKIVLDARGGLIYKREGYTIAESVDMRATLGALIATIDD